MTTHTIRRAAALSTILALGACASLPAMVPAHGQTIEQSAADQLYCEQVANGINPGVGGGFVAASGRPQFVGAVMGGYALGTAIAAGIHAQHVRDDYSLCMTARGYAPQGAVVQTLQTQEQ